MEVNINVNHMQTVLEEGTAVALYARTNATLTQDNVHVVHVILRRASIFRAYTGMTSARSSIIFLQWCAPFMRLKQDRIIIMDIRSAEMTRYASNATLATKTTKISFINQMTVICAGLG